MIKDRYYSSACLPLGSWWCCCRSFEVCCWGCSPGHLERCCRLPEYAGSVSPDPDESSQGTNYMCQLGEPNRTGAFPLIEAMHKKNRLHTSDPNMSFLSWMRIHPILQPGTSQRLAKPPQERMGTSLLRDAMDGQAEPGKTWEQEREQHELWSDRRIIHGQCTWYAG